MTELLANPALLLICGGLVLPLLPAALRGALTLALPLVGIALLLSLPAGVSGQVTLFGFALDTIRVDALALIFALIFHIAALIAAVYALHERDRMQQSASLVYAGGAIGAVLAGDLLTLLLHWELTALSSVLLVVARRTPRALRTGMRYFVIQVASGVLLMAGLIVREAATGSLAFDRMDLSEPGAALILLAFGIKCAFPLLHNWLQDAYPESTPTGTVVLSVFTTKLAVYALARGFPGTEMLVWIGATMTVFPIFYAVIENDLRRVLSYSLNNQLGFMVAGIGIGTELAINGAAAHAFAHILYKALLFMSMGAVLLRVGTVKASELGGLYKSMPWTAGFCIVGSLSISAFPLFSGFVTKSMILAAAAEEHRWLLFLVLLFASAGVLDHSGIKVPFFSFFAHDSGKRCAEAPRNMLLAMGVTAALCIGIGIWPDPLYALLPYQTEFRPYTLTHVVTQLQLLMFALLAFVILYRRGWYPPEVPSVNLDFDWTYRKAAPALARAALRGIDAAGAALAAGGRTLAARLSPALLATVSPGGLLARETSSRNLLAWTLALLALALLGRML